METNPVPQETCDLGRLELVLWCSRSFGRVQQVRLFDDMWHISDGHFEGLGGGCSERHGVRIAGGYS
jgi:hypothetical protein